MEEKYQLQNNNKLFDSLMFRVVCFRKSAYLRGRVPKLSQVGSEFPPILSFPVSMQLQFGTCNIFRDTNLQSQS